MIRSDVEASPPVLTPPTLTVADDGFHDGADPWFTEGSFFAIQLPARNLGMWVYHQTRRNLGIASGGVWVWDDTASSCFEVPYYNNRQLQLLAPGPHDFNDFTWPDGVRQQTLEPLRQYRLTFDDPGRLSFDLVFTALIAPAVLLGGSPPRPHRLDQACTVKGHMVLHGERIDIDCTGARDHSWEIRPEGAQSPQHPANEGDANFSQRPVVYLYGAASAQDAFFLLAPRSVPMASCYAIRNGRRRGVAAVSQRLVRDPADGHIESLVVEMRDDAGDIHLAEGMTRSWMIRPSPSGVGLLHVVEWTINGQRGWGELQDIWPADLWSHYRRNIARQQASAD